MLVDELSLGMSCHRECPDTTNLPLEVMKWVEFGANIVSSCKRFCLSGFAPEKATFSVQEQKLSLHRKSGRYITCASARWLQ